MAERDLQLNSLARFAKQSPHLILEEYGNCEVPAGCGGVVLRWRNPDQGIPVPVRLFTPGTHRAYLDGAPLETGRPLIPFGEHVLALEIEEIDPRYLVLLFAAVYEETGKDGIRRSRPSGQRVAILSTPDGSWKYTTVQPAGEGWTGLPFDDADWPAMRENDRRRPPADPQYDPDRWSVERLTRLGAVPLGIEGAAGRVWVRKRFTLVPSGEDAHA